MRFTVVALVIACTVASGCGPAWPSTCAVEDRHLVCQCHPARVKIGLRSGTVRWSCVTPRGEEVFPLHAEGGVEVQTP